MCWGASGDWRAWGWNNQDDLKKVPESMRYEGERRRKDTLLRRGITEVLHWESRVLLTLAAGEGFPACLRSKLPGLGVLFTKNLFRGKVFWGNQSDTIIEETLASYPQSSEHEGATNKYQVFVQNQQHEEAVPRLTRTADLGGKRDNSGNRRGVKKNTAREVHWLKQ